MSMTRNKAKKTDTNRKKVRGTAKKPAEPKDNGEVCIIEDVTFVTRRCCCDDECCCLI